MTSADLRPLLARADSLIAAGVPLPEPEALALAKDMIAAAAAVAASGSLTPEVFAVAETLLKLRALGVPVRDKA